MWAREVFGWRVVAARVSRLRLNLPWAVVPRVVMLVLVGDDGR